MKTSGEVEARELRGASLPLGPVAPQATFWPESRVAWTPAQIAEQIFA
jgi:hypothetical protein